VISLKDVSIAQLTKLRENESDFLRGLRRTYRREVDKYIAQVTAVGSHADDLRRIGEEFNRAMCEHLRELYRMLNRRAKIVDFSVTEVLAGGLTAGVVTYLSSGHSLAVALAAAAATIGAGGVFKIAGSIPLNAEKREEILQKNPAAWLYHVQENTT